jgi:hypothetical protein
MVCIASSRSVVAVPETCSRKKMRYTAVTCDPDDFIRNKVRHSVSKRLA